MGSFPDGQKEGFPMLFSRHFRIAWPKAARVPVAALVALAVAACAPAGAPDGQPTTVSQRSAADQRLGDQEHPKILAQFGGEVKDTELRRYVRNIGRRLAANSEQPEGPWTFTVLDSPVVNAFALPGGPIYVNSGLIAQADNEAQLAGVIGHEIGHVILRHSTNQASKSSLFQLPALLAAGALDKKGGMLAASGKIVSSMSDCGSP